MCYLAEFEKRYKIFKMVEGKLEDLVELYSDTKVLNEERVEYASYRGYETEEEAAEALYGLYARGAITDGDEVVIMAVIEV